MSASFLNYCATCEKQINVPNNSILYCSESCRRKDSVKPLAMSSSVMVSPTASSFADEASPARSVLPPLTPSASTSLSSPQIRIPSELHDAKSDLDPTEWKPKLQRPRLTSSKSNSAAFQYLSQFHRSTSNCALGENEIFEKSPLGSVHRSTVSMASLYSAPSLATSPDTAASSMDTDLAAQSYTYGYGDSDFATRALPPRINPEFSSRRSISRGMDLVVPHCAPPQPAIASSVPDVPFQGGLWEKRSVSSKSSIKANEGLSALFAQSHETVTGN